MVGNIIGSYRIVRKLGEGGIGAVYLGQHVLLRLHAAIKVLRPATCARPGVKPLIDEARAIAAIQDPGIVHFLEFGVLDDGSEFIVMEYLEGESLDHRLARLDKLPVHEALRLTSQITLSLAVAHAQRIIHRDIKPQNIFLVPAAEGGARTKILDFGIAKLSDEHPDKSKTATGVVMGTPIYMSPEQCRGLINLDHRSDIYALGCVLFHMLTGAPPFDGEGSGDVLSAHIREPAPAPSTRVPGILPSVDALVLRCLAKAPADRYQTMAELSAAIAQLLELLGHDAASTISPLDLPPTAKMPPAGRSTTTTIRLSSGQFDKNTDPVDSTPPKRRGRWFAAIVAGSAVAGLAVAVTCGGAMTGVATTAARASEGSAEPSSATAPPNSDVSITGRNAAPEPSVTYGVPANPVDVKPAADLSRTTSATMAKADTLVNSATSDDRGQPNAVTARASERPRKPLRPAYKGAPPTSNRFAQSEQRQTAEESANSTQPVTSAEATPGTSATAGQPSLPNRTPIRPSDSPSNKCAEEGFSAVWDEKAPAQDSVQAALKQLDECHAAHEFNDDVYDLYRTTLRRKLPHSER